MGVQRVPTPIVALLLPGEGGPHALGDHHVHVALTRGVAGHGLGAEGSRGAASADGGGAAGEGILQGSPLPSQHAPRELPLPLGGHSPDGAEHRLQVLGAQLLLQHGQAEHLSLGGLGAPPCSALGLLVPVEAHRPPQHRQDSCTVGSLLTSTSPSPRFPISPRQKPPWPSSDAQAGCYHLPVHTPPWGLADSLLPPPTSRFPLSS